MPDFAIRSSQEEIMDDLDCRGDVLKQTLHELEVINTFLGGNAVTMNGLKKLMRQTDLKEEIVLADLGCGRGDMLLLIDAWAQRKGYRIKLIGFDANPNTVLLAKAHVGNHERISFCTEDIFSTEFRQRKFDIVIGTLFYHHFSSETLRDFFSSLRNQTKIGILINDIHRHPLAYYSIKYLTRFFSRSSMVKFDAPLSVLRAFHKKELLYILATASFKRYTIRWKWAFRWQVVAFTN